MDNREKQANYPTVKKTKNSAIGSIATGLFFGSLSIYFLIKQIVDFYIYDSVFIIILFAVLSLACAISFLAGLAGLKITCYELNCPCCKQKTYFPTNEQSCDCECCNKKLIMDNGTIHSLDELEKQ